MRNNLHFSSIAQNLISGSSSKIQQFASFLESILQTIYYQVYKSISLTKSQYHFCETLQLRIDAIFTAPYLQNGNSHELGTLCLPIRLEGSFSKKPQHAKEVRLVQVRASVLTDIHHQFGNLHHHIGDKSNQNGDGGEVGNQLLAA